MAWEHHRDRPSVTAGRRWRCLSVPRLGANGHRRPVRVGLMTPGSGPAGIWGPSCRASASLAAAEINHRGGLCRRELVLVGADSGGSAVSVAAAARALVDDQQVDAVVAMHISATRPALVTALAGRVPYVYTPLYEGGECHPGVFAIGETSDRQLRPAIAWMSEQRRTRRWYLIGNDYVWPWVSHAAARRWIAAAGNHIVGEQYLPFGLDVFDPVLARIAASAADVVLVSLVGTDAVAFNRAFGESGLARRMLRLSTAFDENTLLGVGAENAENLYSVAGYFATLDTPENQAFAQRYRTLLGTPAPVPSNIGQSCYEGLQFLAALAGRANSLHLADLIAAAEGLRYCGARGSVEMRNGTAVMPMWLLQADGLDFRPVARFSGPEGG